MRMVRHDVESHLGRLEGAVVIISDEGDQRQDRLRVGGDLLGLGVQPGAMPPELLGGEIGQAPDVGAAAHLRVQVLLQSEGAGIGVEGLVDLPERFIQLALRPVGGRVALLFGPPDGAVRVGKGALA